MTTALPRKETVRPMPRHATSFIPIAANCGYLHFGGSVEVQLLIPPPHPLLPFRLFGVSAFRRFDFRLSASDVPIFPGNVTLL